MKIYHRRLKKVIKKSGKSLEEVCQESGADLQEMKEFFDNDNPLLTNSLIFILDYFWLSLDWLVGRGKNKKIKKK